MLTVRAGLSFLRLISPFVRSRAASLAGAAALLVAYSAAAVSPALITQQLVDRGLATGDVPLVAALALALVAAAATQSVLSVLAARVLSEAGEGVAADLRAELVRRALDAPAGWMAGRDDGYVAARVTEASGVSALFSKTSFTFASSVLQAAGSAVAVAAMSPSVLAFAIVPIPAYVWCAGRSLKAYRASVAAAAEAAAGLTGRVAEAVSGREEAAASGGSRLVAGRVGGASERVRSASVRQSVLAALTGEGMSLLYGERVARLRRLRGARRLALGRTRARRGPARGEGLQPLPRRGLGGDHGSAGSRRPPACRGGVPRAAPRRRDRARESGAVDRGQEPVLPLRRGRAPSPGRAHCNVPMPIACGGEGHERVRKIHRSPPYRKRAGRPVSVAMSDRMPRAAASVSSRSAAARSTVSSMSVKSRSPWRIRSATVLSAWVPRL